MKSFLWCTRVAMFFAALSASSASAAVIGATVADASSGNYTLTSVSINRAGAGMFTYLPSQLIGIDVTDTDQFSIPLATPVGSSLPVPGTRASLLEDGRLDTGLMNITTTNGTADRSLRVDFLTPIVNSNGEDFVVFEIDGGSDSIRFWINEDRDNQSADDSTFSPNLLTGMPFTTFAYNNNGDANINSLEELESPTGFQAGVNTSGIVRAIGLDLSNLGVPLGGSVSSIRMQSVATGNRFDPVFIAGLPAVPEPASMALLGLAGMMLIRRGR